MLEPPSNEVPLIVLAVASVVAVDALPVKAPVNPVEVTEVKPAIVVEVAPNAVDVEPIVIELLVNCAFPIPVTCEEPETTPVGNNGVTCVEPLTIPDGIEEILAYVICDEPLTVPTGRFAIVCAELETIPVDKVNPFIAPVVVIEPVIIKSFPNTILVPPELKNLAVPSCMLTFPLTEIKPAVGSNNTSPPPEDFNSISPSTVCNIILSVPNSLNLID